MGSPLGVTLINVFVCYFEKIWKKNQNCLKIKDCLTQFKPLMYKIYMDNTISLSFFSRT